MLEFSEDSMAYFLTTENGDDEEYQEEHMAEKKYCGQGKAFGDYGSVKIGLRAADLPPANEAGYINIVVAKRKEASDKGNTHYAYVDEYKPNSTGGGNEDQAPLPEDWK